MKVQSVLSRTNYAALDSRRALPKAVDHVYRLDLSPVNGTMIIDPNEATRGNLRTPFWAAAQHISSSPTGANSDGGSQVLLTRYRKSHNSPSDAPPMVKLMVAARRRSDLTADQFQQYWLNQHGPLVARCATALRIQRYVQNHSIDSAAAQMFGVNRELGTSFDGIAEGWWVSEADMVSAFTSPEGRVASAALAEDEKNFCSNDNRVLVGHEFVFIDDFTSI